MNIGLVDCDKTNYPNLALMKLSGYHKAKGDSVEFVTGFNHYNRIYTSLRLCRGMLTTNLFSEAVIPLLIIADMKR